MIPENTAYNNLKLLSQYPAEELVADEQSKQISKRPQTESTERQAPKSWLGRLIKRVFKKSVEQKDNKAVLREVIKQTFLCAQVQAMANPTHPWLVQLGQSENYGNVAALLSKIKKSFPELPDMELTPVTKSPPRQFSFNGELFDADLTSLNRESSVFHDLLEDLPQVDAPIPIPMLDPSLSLEQVQQFFSYLQGEPPPSSLSEQELLTYLIAADAIEAKYLIQTLGDQFLSKCSSSSLLKLALEKEFLFLTLLTTLPKKGQTSLLKLLKDLKNPLYVVVSGQPLRIRLKEGKLCQVNGDELQNPLSHSAIVLINRQQLLLNSLGTVKEILDFLGDKAAWLKVADLYKLEKLTDNELKAFLNRCPNLEYLRLPQHIAGDVLTHLKFTPNLKSLNLDGCEKLDPHSLYNLRHVPHLESLNITFCKSLNPNALENLHYAPNLLHLIAVGCTHFDPDSLESFRHTSNLEVLDLSFCPQFRPADLKNLKLKYTPKLKFLKTSFIDLF